MDPAREIEKLREHRTRPERDTSIASLVRQTAESAARTHRRLGEIIELWEQVIPAELAAHTRITTLRGGMLYVDADSASDRFELDRVLREGAEQELRRRYGGTRVGVRVKIG